MGGKGGEKEGGESDWGEKCPSAGLNRRCTFCKFN